MCRYTSMVVFSAGVLLVPEQLEQDPIVQQLAPRSDFGSRCPVTSMICAAVAPAISADVTNPQRRMCAPIGRRRSVRLRHPERAASPLRPPAAPRFSPRAAAVRRKRNEQRALLLLADSQPRLERRERARPVLEPWHGHELSCADTPP
jgi:hypothetical protein